jgi:hypothetical protein
MEKSMVVTRTSPLSGKSISLELPISEEQYRRWQQGELIQNAMPNLDLDQREFVISGLAPGEFEKVFEGVD